MKVGDMVRVKVAEGGAEWSGQYGYVHATHMQPCATHYIGNKGYVVVRMLSTEVLKYWPLHILDNITEQADAVQDR